MKSKKKWEFHINLRRIAFLFDWFLQNINALQIIIPDCLQIQFGTLYQLKTLKIIIMKTLKLIALALFGTTVMFAQDLKQNEVPTEITTKFQKDFANAKDVEWEQDGMNYKAEFDINAMEYEIWYNKSGERVKLEKEITATDLPSVISSTLKSKYADYKIDSVEMVETDAKNTYEIELEKGWSKELKVVLDSNGTILSSVED